MNDHPTTAMMCPSAQPAMADAVVFGVVLGSAADPRVAYLERPVAVVEAAHGLDGVDPAVVFRIAATCEEQRCAHHSASRCSLGARVVAGLPAVVDVLPRCVLRSACRWYAEQGSSACRRCPQVVTSDTARPGNAHLAVAAQPPRT